MKKEQDIKMEIRSIAEEVGDEFNVTIKLDEIKFCDNLEDSAARAIRRHRAGVKTHILELDDEIAEYDHAMRRAIVAHEMVHFYCYQNGFPEVTDGDRIFDWLCGRALGSLSGISPNEHRFKSLAWPMIRDADKK